MVAGEFNGDHKLDLAVANTRSNDVSVLIADTGKIDVLGVALPECLFGICVPWLCTSTGKAVSESVWKQGHVNPQVKERHADPLAGC